jgi:hypothetical protein
MWRLASVSFFLASQLGRNLDRGLTPKTGELLCPSEQDDQRLSIEKARLQARAIMAVNQLLACDRRLPDAARQVFHALKVKHAGLIDSTEALIELRKRAQRGKAAPDVLALLKMPLPEEAGRTPAEKAAWLISMLA